jgi:hypothetical protein
MREDLKFRKNRLYLIVFIDNFIFNGGGQLSRDSATLLTIQDKYTPYGGKLPYKSLVQAVTENTPGRNEATRRDKRG